MVATEAALWGAVATHGFLDGTVIVSDDAGQFNVGEHALCWVHARAAKEGIRTRIWDLYADLKTYRADPSPRRKAELLRVLDRPEIPLHTNGSENDIRCQVIRRKVSGTTRSDDGRDCRDAFLSLAKTCRKLGISFWHYLGARLGAIDADRVPSLPELVAARSSA